MSDNFIRSLKSDWQSQDFDSDRVLRRLRRNRWVPHVVLGAEILICTVTFLVGLWFAWAAAQGGQHALLYALSSGVLLLTAPALCVASVMARSPSLAWHVETPESLLNVAMRRAESSLRVIRIGRWHVAIVAVFAGSLWALTALGLIQANDFLIFYTTICVAVCLASWFWMAWREKRARRELAACAHLLSTLQVDAART